MITIYRDGSRVKQVLEVKKGKSYYDQLAGKKFDPESSQEIPALPLKRRTPQEAWGMRVRRKADVGWVYTSVFRDVDNAPVEVFINIGKTGGYVAGAAEVTGRLASRALKYGASLEEIASDLIGISCGTPYGFGPESVLSAFDAVGKSLVEIARAKQLQLPMTEEMAATNEEITTLQIPNPMPAPLVTLSNGHTNGHTNGHSNGHTNGNSNGQLTVSSSINLPQTVTEGAIAKNQLSLHDEDKMLETKFTSCPDCGSPLVYSEGCRKCINETCGWSKCS
ncbi:hypothetical protein HY024_04435 [Candidatus Curtissbacteria bacterium]|nr:hypothetical protein [Candidatus Curtissbacteria bacterium]